MEDSERRAPAVDAGGEPLGNVIEINLPAAVAADIDDDATGHAILYAVTTCKRALALCEKLLLERSASASRAATSRNAS